MLYRNCRELPVHNFNEIVITNNLSFLIKDQEEHKQEELKSHWKEIITEYETLIDDSKIAYMYRLKAEIIYLKQKIQFLILAQAIYEAGYDISEHIKPIKPQELKTYISAARNTLNLKLKQEANDGKESKDIPINAFEEAIATAKGNGYLIDRYTLPVSEWIAISSQLEKKAKEIEKIKNKNR
jgi:hypothetical protein